METEKTETRRLFLTNIRLLNNKTSCGRAVFADYLKLFELLWNGYNRNCGSNILDSAKQLASHAVFSADQTIHSGTNKGEGLHLH